MLSRRNREPPPSRTEPTSSAARAKDLGALRDAVVDAASVSAGLWLSYLFALFYFAIAAGAVTHRDLLLENPVKLPFLNVELPLKAFFVLGPVVFLILHVYVLLFFVLLAGKIGTFHAELQVQIAGDDARARLRRQLPTNIFVQFIAGPREVRTGVVGFLLRQVAQISLVVGPIALLILFQLQFLPYHSEWITNWQRVAVVFDLVLLWLLWPPIARGETALLGRKDFKRVKVLTCLLASTLPVLLVVTIATFPGEVLEKLPPIRIVPTGWPPWGSDWLSLHELLVAGEVNYVTGRPQSLWSNVLVLPNIEVGDRALSLRGRSLEGAVLVGAHLRKADFTGAWLAGANFNEADLREARFQCALTGREEGCAQLQGASFFGAQLQGASLDRAWLQGASLRRAQMQGATLVIAQLQGATLEGAQLQGASLLATQLPGANLNFAQLQGAFLDHAGLQGAILDGAQLQGASLKNVLVWRASLPRKVTDALVGAAPDPKYRGLDCPLVPPDACDWTEASYKALRAVITNWVPAGFARDQALERITKLENPPYVRDEALAEAWYGLAKSSPSEDVYYQGLSQQLREIGCDGDQAPYVIGGLIRQLDRRFKDDAAQEAKLAEALLDETKCLGARGLSEEGKASLQRIIDAAPKPSRAGPKAVGSK
jgi:uncharacterized protein YjbI with pentapeptide repeats